jgi:hypothetical protein
MKLKKVLLLVITPLILTSLSCSRSNQSVKDDYTVAVYYFPNYHLDKRNENYFGKGWTEWKLVKEARPRFEGQQQPKVPLWGYTDEADPLQMARKIEAASSNGIDAFIFDWYYYNDGIFLERGLENGFMKAANNNLMKFSLMWANHDYTDIFPYTAGKERKLMYPGVITPETWDKMTSYIIEKYFKHPSYWLINGAPYFSVYDLSKLLAIFGSVEGTAKGLEDFRTKTKAAGFCDLHLNAVVWGQTILPGEKKVENPADLVKELGFNSFTSYVWIHHVRMKNFPVTSYDSVRSGYFKYADKAATDFSIPYFPNVSMGWDSSPRTNQDSTFGNFGYPYTPVIAGNSPEAFRQALIESKKFMDTHLVTNKILTINSWNEWTEGSYLEPDTLHKLQYLEALKDVFGNQTK